MPSQRQLRVARQVLQSVSNIVENQVSDPRIGMVTFTDARVSPDLRNATVYFAAHGGPQAEQDCAEALKRAGSYIRRELGRAISLRYTPALVFELDEGPERAERIERLLAESPPPSDRDDNGDA